QLRRPSLPEPARQLLLLRFESSDAPLDQWPELLRPRGSCLQREARAVASSPQGLVDHDMPEVGVQERPQLLIGSDQMPPPLDDRDHLVVVGQDVIPLDALGESPLARPFSPADAEDPRPAEVIPLQANLEWPEELRQEQADALK